MTSNPKQQFRISAVSYLNAHPLIHGLGEQPDIALSLDVPARLIDGLKRQQCDIALLPVIDLQRIEHVSILPVGGIGCDGPTLTVRIFSQTPIEKITTLACDPDSHTSVALARIILRERYGLSPEFIHLADASNREGEARLLIGDKVVCEEPAGFEHQLDLGGAWKDLTGLPFVFAVWAARCDLDLGDLPQRLTNAREAGMNSLPAIIRKYAIPRGWPEGLALQYLSVYLKYEIGARQLEAIRLFHSKAAALGIIEAPRTIEVVEAMSC